MHPEIKRRPAGEKATITSVKPLLLHEVTHQSASANAASRRRTIASPPASGAAHHAPSRRPANAGVTAQPE